MKLHTVRTHKSAENLPRAAQLAWKIANSLSTSNRLHKTYGPAQLAAVRDADEARQKGRAN